MLSDNLKRLKGHPSYSEYLEQWTKLYQNKNYDNGISGYFLKKSHEWAESEFGSYRHFDSVLEVGAGTGMHIKYVRHSFKEYYLTDLNPLFMQQLNLQEYSSLPGKVIALVEDATKLTFEDNYFDRVIAAHTLEHLCNPHEVLQEWARVLKPGGILSLVLPCDPGLFWRLGRYMMVRNKFINAGFLYDYWMAREHINPINNLVSFVRYYFSDVREKWLPMHIPSIDLNLFYIANIKV